MATAAQEIEQSSDDTDQTWSGVPDHTNRLATLIPTTDCKHMYNLQNIRDFVDREREDIDIDQRNDQGQTPLMRASFDRNKNAVEFLLANGADPNLRCLKEGNTALHYVCQCHWTCGTDSETDLDDCEPFKGKLSEADRSGKDVSTEESRNATYDRLIIKSCLDDLANECTVFIKQKNSTRIIDFLISRYGALMLLNRNGLTPADIAGLHRKLPTVLHFIDKNYISKSEQIRALEILGSSLMMKDDYEKAYIAFTMAMKKRCENSSDVLTDVTRSELECCLGRTECKNLHDLKSINGDKHAMKVEGILVGDRVIPESLKLEYVYERLVDHGYRLLFQWNTLDAAFVVFTECLHLERQGLMVVGRVLLSLMYSITQATSSPSLHRVVPQYVSLLCHSLETYVDVIRQVKIENLIRNIPDILINLSMTLYSFTNHLCKVQGVNCVLEPVVDMVNVIWRRLRRDSVARDPHRHLTNSICHKLVCDMVAHFRYNYDFEENKYTCHCFKQVLGRLVQVEGATDIDMKGDTLLHSLMGLVFSGEIHMVTEIANLFLRYGCPSRAKNNEGKMPLDIAHQEATSLEDSYRPRLNELYNVLSPTLLTLQELAIRTILRCNIYYQDILPRRLCFILQEHFQDDCDSAPDTETYS